MINKQKRKTVIIKGFEEPDVDEVISQMIAADLWEDRRYREIPGEMDKIFEQYPKVGSVWDWDKSESLNQEEVQALMKVRQLEEEMADIEKKVILETAQREAISLFAKTRYSA